ncbi:unnamed protein product [Darwinula stevensoni]|uniref:Vacuolar protein sorting-associated protein 52 homolog n=1 Tax=Darwinula stevensoni TaxID=69355 RepID=A0A7R9A335_9CRUS|nr:unnamed protein product [Darwinula stevensoni]CAG0881281.1 unnamed protein product [Darwinula stevensoni]
MSEESNKKGDKSLGIPKELQSHAIQEALQKGIDLRQYSLSIEEELKKVENASIQDYIKESHNIANLHNQISACDDILQRMEEMLRGFQSDLGSISGEIATLQQHSVSMNVQLKNRQAIRGQLSQFIDEMIVPENMIRTILDCPVTETDFQEQLLILDQKIAFVKEQSFREARSVQDVRDVLENLKIKVLSKIREFLLQKIYQMRKPMTNYQMPQNAMLKHKYFYQFLMSHEREIAKEVRDEYVETMSKIYFCYFKTYMSRLMKLMTEEVATKEDLLGAEETVRFSLFSTKPSMRNKSTVFTIGQRAEVLTSELEAPIMVPHTSQQTGKKYPFETLFRSEQFALVDNGCREYLFLSEFFMVQDNHAMDLFNSVMGRTISLFQVGCHSSPLHAYVDVAMKISIRQMETFVLESWDSLSLFLCIHLIHRYRLLCHKRAVPALDHHWDALLKLLWPHFEQILMLNLQSLHDCDPHKIAEYDIHPHYISRRYAEYSSSLCSLNDSFPTDNSRVDKLLLLLQTEMQNLLLKMAAVFRDRKHQLMFLINNYDMMLSISVERTREDSKESESFREKLNALSNEYVELLLQPHFGGLLQFVQDLEALGEDNTTMKAQEMKVVTLVKAFNASWKKSLDDIDTEVKTSFPNFKNGNNILQATLTQFVQYYHRFQKILSLPSFKTLPVRSELINIHQLMVEVKKYKPAF